MKNIKYFEDIDFDDFDIEEEYKIDVKVGDKFIVTDELYKKYPGWTMYFRNKLNKKIFTSKGNLIDTNGIHGVWITNKKFYVPIDSIKKIKNK